MNKPNKKNNNAGVKRTDIQEPLLSSSDAPQHHLHSSGNSAPMEAATSLISAGDNGDGNALMKDSSGSHV